MLLNVVLVILGIAIAVGNMVKLIEDHDKIMTLNYKVRMVPFGDVIKNIPKRKMAIYIAISVIGAIIHIVFYYWLIGQIMG